eukprot:1154308-Pelagomonas_calceolata.AAC.8
MQCTLPACSVLEFRRYIHTCNTVGLGALFRPAMRPAHLLGAEVQEVHGDLGVDEEALGVCAVLAHLCLNLPLLLQMTKAFKSKRCEKPQHSLRLISSLTRGNLRESQSQ